MSPTSDARAKLDRAYEHLDSLDREIGVFAKQHSERRVQVHRDGPWHVVTVGPLLQANSQRWALIAGDVVQNARASLDYAACACISRSTGKEPSRWSAFPVYTTEGAFREKVRAPKKNPERSPLYGLPVDGPEWAVIEEAQPYNRSPEFPDYERLAILARLSNLDKHRALYIHMVFPDASDVVVWPSRAHLLEHVVSSEPLSFERSTEAARLRFHFETEVHVKGNLVLYPSFGEEPSDGAIQASLGTIRLCCDRVGEILASLSL